MPDREEASSRYESNVIQVTYGPQEVEGILPSIGFDLERFRGVLRENGDSLLKQGSTYDIIIKEEITGVEIKINPAGNLVVDLVLDFGGKKVVLSYFGDQYILYHDSSSNYMNSTTEIQFMQSLFAEMQSSVQSILDSCGSESV